MSFNNYYDVLQVQSGADLEVIEAAGKALLKKAHPDYTDRNTYASQIIEAREILTNAAKRAKFDAELRARHDNTIGPYKVIEKMAQGGMGAVYKARHLLLDEEVVIKHSLKISAEATQGLKKEARSIWDLRHHAIPVIRDFIELDDGSCAIVMSYIPGPTLEEIISAYREKGKEIDQENVCWLLERVLDALRYVHYFGVVHGDVKPLNIIVQPARHTCYLVDFGLASIRPDRKSRAEGYTPMFAPPEAFDEVPLLPESDLYSLGLVAIYAFGGNPMTRQIPRKVKKPIRDFVGELLVKDIKNRPHWKKCDILQKFREARLEAFGRTHTNFKKLEVP